MSCDYCTSGKNMMRDSCSDVSVGKVDDVYRIYYFSGSRLGSTEPIRFCPMCGEQFPHNPHDSLKSIRDDMALDVCEYAKNRGIRRGNNNCRLSNCAHCEWRTSNEICNRLMVDDLADRLGKLLELETDGDL